MKETELRVGNFVELRGKAHRIMALPFHYPIIDCLDTPFGSFTYDDLNPVQLTPEWLPRFGFGNWFGTCWYRKGSEIHLCHGAPEFDLLIKERSVRDINYVHELQNIFHAIEGVDLPIIDN